MEQQLYIDGMTCKNCTTGVMEKINSIEGVSNIKVSLETGKATFNSTQQIPLSQLSKLLGDRYTLSEVQEEFTKQELTTAAKLNALFPLFLIFGYLICATIFLSYLTNATIENAMLYFMGLFFITFSFFKFLDYKGFPASFSRYDPIAKRSPLYAKMYPFLETGLGIAFLMSWQLPLILFCTLIILSFTTYGVLQSIINKSSIECACLGTALKLPMTEATLIENGIMIVMSCILILGYFL
jgi:copper chaperone CopZ